VGGVSAVCLQELQGQGSSKQGHEHRRHAGEGARGTGAVANGANGCDGQALWQNGVNVRNKMVLPECCAVPHGVIYNCSRQLAQHCAAVLAAMLQLTCLTSFPSPLSPPPPPYTGCRTGLCVDGPAYTAAEAGRCDVSLHKLA
jgi:hypothetical protein